MINDASTKLRAAADVLTPASAKSIYGYLEGDILRHLGGDHRRQLSALLAGIRNEFSPGCPSWQPDIGNVVPGLLRLADEIAAIERVAMTRADYDAKIEAVREEERNKALDAAALVIERKEAEAFQAGLERGRVEGMERRRARKEASGDERQPSA